MWPLGLGAAAWVWTGWWPAAAVVVVLAYVAQCWWFPYRRCWRCRGARWRGDGRGNLRHRNCWVCGGRGVLRRWGAVLMGVVRP